MRVLPSALLRFPSLAVLSLWIGGTAPGLAADLRLTNGLVLATGGRAARTPFRVDALEARLVSGRWVAPQPGEALAWPDGTNRVWEAITAREEGRFQHRAMRAGYLFTSFESPTNGVLLLRATGHSLAYVNGVPRAGDIYANGSTSLPIPVRAGTNELLFVTGRGPVQVLLAEPDRPVMLDARDTTFPDLVRGQFNETHGAVLVVNATGDTLNGLVLTATTEGGVNTADVVPPVPPYGTFKAPFRIRHAGGGNPGMVRLHLELRAGDRVLDQAEHRLRLKEPNETRRETFVSRIDNSVQYYSFVPALGVPGEAGRPGLVLSAHGASVEAEGQAAAYAAKPTLHIAAPTNRRPYGFDWEDWGRRDAIEVLDLVQARYDTDRSRTYLTGHSMGGHGTWQMGVTLPDRFAALAPSAGWISFATYAGGRPATPTNAVQQLIQRAWTPSDTLALVTNYLHHGLYILHGDADDNVPVEQARRMREALAGFHRDLEWHEQVGAGHWWGNACVDWPPIFACFARHRIPADAEWTHVRFATANPGISASSHWVTIEAQEHALARSSVDIRWEAGERRFVGSTENVGRLSLGLGHLGLAKGSAPVIELDGARVEGTPAVREGNPARVHLARQGGVWKVAEPAPRAHKGPHRHGPFKEAFNHRMVLVYGTRGTPEENAWSLARARFDSESFRYRGNASLELMPDTAFRPEAEPDRGVILYGNADNNAAWGALLQDSPIQVRRSGVRVGGRTVERADLACLFLRPRPGSDTACVGVVSGTGMTGLRLTERVPYFLAGVALPDFTLFGTESLERAWGGALSAGFFGNDWSLESGEVAWID